ncbi:hypothetical protein [Nonomuraea roseola]|uniref:LPXTG cell wall anchor domain-containing protein n=1 Tax=Nonomuraea roseola TaxID=46179 RepID=A0ABV5Q134_9ACTN
MRSVLATAVCAGALLLAAPATATPILPFGGDITVTPQWVEPGGEVSITLDCDDHDHAFVESEAFGEVELDGEEDVDLLVDEEPGRYAVHGQCGPDGPPLNDTWLVVEDDYPYGGVETGAGGTAMRAVSPAVSAGVGVLAAAAIGGGALFLRRRRAGL